MLGIVNKLSVVQAAHTDEAFRGALFGADSRLAAAAVYDKFGLYLDGDDFYEIENRQPGCPGLARDKDQESDFLKLLDDNLLSYLLANATVEGARNCIPECVHAQKDAIAEIQRLVGEGKRRQEIHDAVAGMKKLDGSDSSQKYNVGIQNVLDTYKWDDIPWKSLRLAPSVLPLR